MFCRLWKSKNRFSKLMFRLKLSQELLFSKKWNNSITLLLSEDANHLWAYASAADPSTFWWTASVCFVFVDCWSSFAVPISMGLEWNSLWRTVSEIWALTRPIGWRPIGRSVRGSHYNTAMGSHRNTDGGSHNNTVRGSHNDSMMADQSPSSFQQFP